MRASSERGICGITRRGFLLGTGVGLTGGAAVGALGQGAWQLLGAPPPVATPGKASTVTGMPGRFPGRVIEVHDPASVGNEYDIRHPVVRSMVERGMTELVGGDHSSAAWRSLFEKDDVVGIKVNPVGHRDRASQGSSISSHELVIEVVAGLRRANVPLQNIILFERYADQFRKAGYERLADDLGVRWYASSAQYTTSQLDIEGYDLRRDRDEHVVGYDPDVFTHMGYSQPASVHHPKDDRRLRSHLSVIVTRMVNKIINLPVLKDHGSAGVTLALKNLSHGLNNNVARSHLQPSQAGEGIVRPNQCNTFIPTVVAQPALRDKTVLHILDGLIGVFQGGPSASPAFVWPYRSLFFATDPVALDHIGWNIVDAKRVERGLLPVGKVGRQATATGTRESFDRRQPEHIILAQTIGLGVFDQTRIDYRRLDTPGTVAAGRA